VFGQDGLEFADRVVREGCHRGWKKHPAYPITINQLNFCPVLSSPSVSTATDSSPILTTCPVFGVHYSELTLSTALILQRDDNIVLYDNILYIESDT
jgi:hypothetical protein